MISGPLAYETIKANFQYSLPSLSATNRYIANDAPCIVEGELRSKELLFHLEQRKMPLIVALSEDATRIVGRIQYDSKSNNLVGFVLPNNVENGMPIPFSFPARTAAEIEKYFHCNTTNPASFVNVVMAQPLKLNNPPFCLLIFGSDNRYTAITVSKRWNYIIDDLKKYNIKVLTFASDSDPKYNSVMRHHLRIGMNTPSIIFPNSTWFNCDENILNDERPFYMQDTVHIGTKLRNRILSKTCTLIIGKFVISVNHLNDLINRFSRDKHYLTASVVEPKDRMNFDSVLRICDEKVIELLKNVPGSDGTIIYLKLIDNIIKSYMDPNITPLERVELIWYAVFLLRIWRNFLSTHKKYNLKTNFLSLNCYTCVELNAHNLVLCILYLKKINSAEHFLPVLYGSQQCESIFRQIRSFTSTYSTVVNCSVLEIIQRLKKIDLQNEITFVSLPNFSFPRIGNKTVTESSVVKNKQLPSEVTIFEAIEGSKRKALADAERLGIRIGNSFDFSCSIKPLHQIVAQKAVDKEDKTSIDVGESGSVLQNKTLRSINNIQLKNYLQKINPEEITEKSPYVAVSTPSGDKYVKKSSLCYIFSQPQHLSNERLERVRSG